MQILLRHINILQCELCWHRSHVLERRNKRCSTHVCRDIQGGHQDSSCRARKQGEHSFCDLFVTLCLLFLPNSPKVYLKSKRSITGYIFQAPPTKPLLCFDRHGSTCSCLATYNSDDCASARHKSLYSGLNACHESRILHKNPPRPQFPRLHSEGAALTAPGTRSTLYCSTSRASEQSEEWFGDDPLLPQNASVSDSDVDSVLFLTGKHRYDNLFRESEDDVAAQLDRRWRSLSVTASTSRNAGRQSGQGLVSDGGVDQPTELILQLDKFGSGWGEELFPRASFVQRPIEKKTRIRPRSSLPDPWTVCSHLSVRASTLTLYLHEQISLAPSEPEWLQVYRHCRPRSVSGRGPCLSSCLLLLC